MRKQQASWYTDHRIGSGKRTGRRPFSAVCMYGAGTEKSGWDKKHMMYVNHSAMQTKYRFLTGSGLKWIAVVSMTIDHLAAVVLKGYVNAWVNLFSEKQLADLGVLYGRMRNLGRTAFPLFAFLLTEGFFHTEDRKRYGLRLAVFALLSEIPYDLAVYGQLWYPERQNTLFTLLLGLLLMEAAERAGKRLGGAAWLFVFAAGSCLAWQLGFDYTYRGIWLIGIFYFFHAYRTAAAAAGFCLFCVSPFSLPAFVLILFYNGRRSGRPAGSDGMGNAGKNGKGKYWFYLFYPLHLLILYGILAVVRSRDMLFR